MPKLIDARIVGSDASSGSAKDPKLVGDINQVKVRINNVDTTALLDTGSVVSMLSQSFYKEHLGNLELEPLQEILNIECADGEQLPYLGYGLVDMDVGSSLEKSDSRVCLFLVVPDTSYSSRTQVIIGTNILNELLGEYRQNFGPKFLQKAKLHTPRYVSFRSMVFIERKMKKTEDRIAIIRSAAQQRIVLHPNETLDLPAYADKQVRYPTTASLLQESEEANIPDYLDVSPGVVNYCYGQRNEYRVTLSNLSTNTVCIEPRAVICELQPVKVADEVMNRMKQEDIEEKRTHVVNGADINAGHVLPLDK